MPSFQRCDPSVVALAAVLIGEFHEHLQARGVAIDYLFAYADRDPKTGEQKGDAITVRGRRSLGRASLNGPKERARGLGDALILLDGDWWQTVDDPERRAVLDHELTHFAVPEEVVRDKQGRPKLVLREHDVEVGWFREVARRHGSHSAERRQAAELIERDGQLFFPELVAAGGGGGRFSKLDVRRAKR
jgi:hypothetical protein